MDKTIKRFLVRLNGTTIGLIGLAPSRDADADSKTGEIVAIYLLEQYHGKGYGRELIDAMLDYFQISGFQHVTLWALEANRAARGFYEHCGFILDGGQKELEQGKCCPACGTAILSNRVLQENAKNGVLFTGPSCMQKSL